MKDELFANYKTLESDRLLLKPITLDDTSDLFEIYSNKEVMHYFDDREAFVEPPNTASHMFPKRSVKCL
ncbi:MAG: GNAT family N-acetyltransferase [Eubacterium sp.]|nr:GNAT family N-acetyltransferase [Eubacterium sp.]